MCSPEVMRSVSRQLAGTRALSRRSVLASAAGAALTAGFVRSGAMAQTATPESRVRELIVDCSYTMTPTIPLWPGNEPFHANAVKSFADDGFYAQEVAFWEHTGTHLDAPAHFSEGNDTAELIPAANLYAPIVVVDIADRAMDDPDAAMSVDDVLAYEREFGEIPAGAFVAMHSGWGARWDDPEAFVNLDADGVQHYPGIHPDAADFLVNKRDIVGIGVDTLSQDPGNSTDFGTHVTILGAGKYGVEGLAHLDLVQPAGAMVFVGGPKHEGASGGPARVIVVNRAL